MILSLFGNKSQKVPIIKTIPVPIPIFWGLLGKNPPKSPKLKLSPSPKYPRKNFGDFWGWNPKKTPKLNPTPSPKIPWSFFKSWPRPRPVPDFLGTGRGKPHYHTISDPRSCKLPNFNGFKWTCYYKGPAERNCDVLLQKASKLPERKDLDFPIYIKEQICFEDLTFTIEFWCHIIPHLKGLGGGL